MDDVFDIALKEIDETIAGYQDRVVSGSCPDYAEYRNIVGQIRGLEIARSIVKELQSRYIED